MNAPGSGAGAAGGGGTGGVAEALSVYISALRLMASPSADADRLLLELLDRVTPPDVKARRAAVLSGAGGSQPAAGPGGH